MTILRKNPKNNYMKKLLERCKKLNEYNINIIVPNIYTMSQIPLSPQKQLDELLKIYLDNVIKHSKQGQLELEVRFGTARGMKPIQRQNYDDVVQRLLSAGFNINEGKYLLRMQNEFIDVKTGITKLSNLRTEILGIGNISEYCKSNELVDKYGKIKGSFIQKSYFKRENNENVYPVNFNDFNFRVALQNEKSLNVTSPIVKDSLSKWSDIKKVFRYINRYSLTHNILPINVDVSIVKESKRKGRNLIPSYIFADSGVIESGAHYEIEIEIINEKVGMGTPYSTPELLGRSIKQGIKLVLSGLQGTNYPVSYDEQYSISQDYMRLLWKDNYKENMRVYSKNFVGPSSYTLQMQNISPINADANIPNIRNNYTVTDKADGIRKLLYVALDGKIYLIDQNMNIQFTGAGTKKNNLFNTLIDGEHILHNKEKKFINLYAAFDIYYIKGKDIRSYGFIQTKPEDNALNFRLPILVSVINELIPQGIKGTSVRTLSPIRIERKTFYSDSNEQSIFQACAVILQKSADGLFEYETDGLIFTPSNTGVGADKIGQTTKPIKITWSNSFKWKPPEFNTVDFLITTKKTPTGTDFIGNIFQNGTDTSIATQLTQYKTVILRVGFDEAVHGYVNPCQNILNDDMPKGGNPDNDEGYHPMQFFPTNPADDEAGISNILLRDGASGDKVMFSEENEVIEDNTIVEFRYDIDSDKRWRWKPLRVRYDKTAEFRAGGRNYGNAYHVANSNWHSIHNPVTKRMLSSGEDIPDELADDDIYYYSISGSDSTRGLRDFHNLFVKKLLIKGVSKRGDTLIDLAVGKGGDIPKWISSKLKFVFGVDLSRDNIHNRLNGACARYLNYRKKFRVLPDVLFVNGNSAVNIRNTDGIITDKGKQITRAVFGQGPKDAKELGQGVYKQYGKGEEGFDVCSMQFSLHYMFENQITLQNFLRNVSETTKVGGYFIGTSYDGDIIFNMLKSKKDGESSSAIMDGNKKIWEITKRYDREDFPDNSSSVGYAVDVYQESINNTYREYLVNFAYLDRLLENYGFVKLTREEALEHNLPSSTGLFSDLFGVMKDEIQRNRRVKNDYGQAANMTAEERKISFLNRYFAYKKVHNVNAEAVANALLGKSIDEEMTEEEQTRKAQEAAKIALLAQIKPTKATKATKATKVAAATKATTAVKPAATKTKRKLKLKV